MQRMNQEGQAFDVFKLLIAAIIAMSILFILVPIVMRASILFTKNPGDETKTLLSVMYDKKDSMQETDKVTFKKDTSLAKATLVGGTPLSKEQVCYHLGDFSDASNEWSSQGDLLIYRGSGERTVKIAVICTGGQEQLNSDIESYFPDYSALSDCECAESDQTCCAVIVRKT